MGFYQTTAQDRMLEPPKLWSRYRIWIGAVGLLVILLVFLIPPLLKVSGIKASVAASRVSIATVEQGRFVRDFAADGRVVAADSPTLYAPTAGNISLSVQAGDPINKNQVLAIVDSPDLEAQLLQERASAEVLDFELRRLQLDAEQELSRLQQIKDMADVDYQRTQREFERSQIAYDRGAYSKQELERAEDAMIKAESELQQASQNLQAYPKYSHFDIESGKARLRRQQLLVEDLERQVAELEIRSPVDGQVGQLHVVDRASVTHDAQLLTVIDLSNLEVEIQVPESFARDLSRGMGTELGGNGGSWPGVINAVSPEVVNGSVVARVRFDGEPPQGLRQNQHLTVKVFIESRDNVLMVSRGGLADNRDGFVYRVEDGIAIRTPVRLGSVSVSRIEITEGLQTGDRVVVSGMDAFNKAERVILSE